jgi:hypothetical protein
MLVQKPEVPDLHFAIQYRQDLRYPTTPLTVFLKQKLTGFSPQFVTFYEDRQGVL